MSRPRPYRGVWVMHAWNSFQVHTCTGYIQCTCTLYVQYMYTVCTVHVHVHVHASMYIKVSEIAGNMYIHVTKGGCHEGQWSSGKEEQYPKRRNHKIMLYFGHLP